MLCSHMVGGVSVKKCSRSRAIPAYNPGFLECDAHTDGVSMAFGLVWACNDASFKERKPWCRK